MSPYDPTPSDPATDEPANDIDAAEFARGAIPGTGRAAFSLDLPGNVPLPVLIAAPHGGRDYPPDVLNSMREPRWSALRLEDRHVDLLATEIARATGAGLLVAHAPRAMIDLNRGTDDIDWSMVTGDKPLRIVHSQANRRARSGLGLVPRRLSGLGEIWTGKLPRAQLDARIESIHRPYHTALERALDTIRDRWGAALLLDLHSMPPLRPRSEHDRPAEFVIGDRFGSSAHDTLVDTTLRHLDGQGRRAVLNRPYSGGYVLDRHASPRRGLHAIQIEVCRSTYLDARFEEPGPRLPGVVRTLIALVRALAMETARLGDSPYVPQAAE